MPMLALIWGIVSFVGFCIALLPCVGWLNWVTIPFAMIGVVLGLVALARAGRERQPQGPAIAGLVLSGTAVLLGTVRLMLGGGIL